MMIPSFCEFCACYTLHLNLCHLAILQFQISTFLYENFPNRKSYEDYLLLFYHILNFLVYVLQTAQGGPAAAE